MWPQGKRLSFGGYLKVQHLPHSVVSISRSLPPQDRISLTCAENPLIGWSHQTPGSAPRTSFSITGSIQFTNPPLKSNTKCQAVTSSPFNCLIISRLLTYDQLNWIMNTIMNLVLVSPCRTADECELWCCCCHSPLTHLVAQVERRPNQMTARN